MGAACYSMAVRNAMIPVKHYIAFEHGEYVELCKWALQYVPHTDVDIITKVDNGIVENTLHPRFYKALLKAMAKNEYPL